jgi:hypothetical protein
MLTRRAAQQSRSGEVTARNCSRAQGKRQMILPAYPLSAGIGSVRVTMHVPSRVSIGSPGWGGPGSSTLSTSSKLGPSMVMM